MRTEIELHRRACQARHCIMRPAHLGEGQDGGEELGSKEARWVPRNRIADRDMGVPLGAERRAPRGFPEQRFHTTARNTMLAHERCGRRVVRVERRHHACISVAKTVLEDAAPFALAKMRDPLLHEVDGQPLAVRHRATTVDPHPIGLERIDRILRAADNLEGEASARRETIGRFGARSKNSVRRARRRGLAGVTVLAAALRPPDLFGFAIAD